MNMIDHKRVTICYVGGDDIHMRIPLLQNLRRRGWTVCVIGSDGRAHFDQAKIPYYQYDLKRGMGPYSDIVALFQLVKLFAKIKPEIVHAFDTKPGMLMPIAARKNNIRGIIRTITGMGYIFSLNSITGWPLQLVYRTLQRIICRFTDMTIFQNSDDYGYFLENDLCTDNNSALVLGSGLDLTEFMCPNLDDETINSLRSEFGLIGGITVTMISRLIKYKGVEQFLKAAQILHERYSDLNFLLVGPHESEGRQAINQDLLEKYSTFVKYLGPRQNIREILLLSDIFVLPSYYREGIPRVLLEAGAMGLPLVTTNMPGCRDVVRDGWNGLIIEPRSVDSLVVALERLILSPAQRSDMGKRNIEYIKEHFDLKIVAKSYSEIYESLLQNYGAQSPAGDLL